MPIENLGHKSGAPYSTAIKANGFLFVSGNVPIDPVTGALIEGGIREQTRQVLENLRAIVEGAGCSLAQVVRVGVYLTDVGDFGAMNEVYREFFPTDPPTRTTVGISALARPEFKIEIDLVAAL
jgi:2-iminobutanoate/2-iminopropanoate deaminase